MVGVAIKNLTRRRLTAPRSVFFAIAKSVLPGWDISLVFIGPKKALELNKQLRGKTYIPNVLSYKVSEKSGEIFICLQEAKKQAPVFCLTPSAYCILLFIHGVLHLKGWAHGAKMEQCERKLLKKYGSENSHRH